MILLPEKPPRVQEGRSQRYIVPGTPIAWKRAGRSGNRFFDQQVQDKINWSIYLDSQHDDKTMFEGPIHVDFLFYFKIPHSHSKKKKLSLLGFPHIFRPDTSNLIKFVEDTITGLLFSDDCIISSLSAKKLYDDEARTEFIITELR